MRFISSPDERDIAVGVGQQEDDCDVLLLFVVR
jgi:hypothetical protein